MVRHRQTSEYTWLQSQQRQFREPRYRGKMVRATALASNVPYTNG